jgi:hypothetical protein
MEAWEQNRSAAVENWDNDAFWTSGEWIGAGQGAGPRHDTGRFHTRQWIGTRQGMNSRSANGNDRWTSGEWIGEGQGAGPRHDTGRFQARQWIGTR